MFTKSLCLAPLFLVGALAVGAAVTTSTAQAQSVEDAASRFAQAQSLYDAGNFTGALPIFEELTRETSSPNARFYVARCLRELGRTVEAYDAMVATVRDATAKAEQEPKYVGTRDASASELALLESRVGHLVLATSESKPPTGLTLNGAAADPSKLGKPITVLPGRVVIEITRADAPIERREVDVPAGETRTVPLSPSSAPSTSASTGGLLRWIGIGVGAGGVVLIATAIGTGVASNDRYSEVEAACGGVRCTDASVVETIDEGKRLETAATATAIIGSLMVAGAVPMIIFGGPEEAPLSVSLLPNVDGSGGMAWVNGRF
jgi:hypothetical protein